MERRREWRRVLREGVEGKIRSERLRGGGCGGRGVVIGLAVLGMMSQAGGG